MTREEARDQIVIFMADEHEVINDRDRQALEMAVKALEQEPCEDCISRAFLIDRLLEKVKTRRSTIEICDKLIPLIKDLPSVQPEADQESKTDGEIIREESVEKILDELEEEFAKIDIPIMDKLTLFAKTTNAIYKFAEQPPKTGHWKRVSIDKYTESAKYWYRCDKCGEKNLGNTNYCPNCGAKMESEG